MADVLITGARIIDGTGNPWFYGDVALTGERIERIAPPGTIDPASATEVIDATGHVVAPGFIDIQSHSIRPFLTDRRSVSKVTQGVTTEIMGENWTPAPVGGEIKSAFRGTLQLTDEALAAEWEERGNSWTRFGDWLADMESRGVSVNVGSFIGGSTVRQYGMGQRMGEPNEAELAAMLKVTDEAMEDGAFGVATALIYPPSAYAGTDELIEIMKVVHKHRGVHITHMRSEAARIYEGLEESLQISEQSGVALEIYHLKAAGEPNWHKMPEVIKRIDAARARGLDVTADMYPYDASGTGLSSRLPTWTDEDGKLYENLRDPDIRAKILAEMRDEKSGSSANPDNMILADLRKPENQQWQGKRLSEAAADLGVDWQEAAVILLEREGQRIFTMSIMMSEENIELQVKQPWIKFSTDAGGLDPETTNRTLTHPRAYGTYTHVLGRFVREKGWLTLEDAIRKSSSAVADRLGLRDRGMLRDGMYADVIVFDPETVIDRSTYTDPHHLSVGIRDVFVNGTGVVRDDSHTGALPGKRVHGPGYRATS